MASFTRFSLITALLLAASCSHDNDKGPPLYMIYSPNGEPLNGGVLGRPTCEQALSRWFDALGAGHNATIPEAVFLGDAQAQFKKMDIDRNGYLVSEELDRYREPFRQQPLPTTDEKDDSGVSGGKHKKARDGAEKKMLEADLSYASSDPVMSADTDLDFRVTLQEFMQQARATFARLDIRHDHLLQKAEVLAECKEKAKP